jgi:hypothetical protein
MIIATSQASRKEQHHDKQCGGTNVAPIGKDHRR